MNKINIFCTSLNHYKIIDKLPEYIIPLGLGKNLFPANWYDEKKGKNISELNHYYGELTGLYWIWKNKVNEMNENEYIGNCHYRKLWLNKNYLTKQRLSFSSLNAKIFNPLKYNINKIDCVQVQPIIFKNKNLKEDFYEIHKTNILEESLNFLSDEYKDKFSRHINEKKLYPLNMFITKVHFFKKYCEVIFPWLEKSLNLCLQRNLCKNYNTRLPAFLAERFTSFWFSQYNNKQFLSYARLGKVFLSNNLNRFINPIKFPFTFRMYPTLHRY